MLLTAHFADTELGVAGCEQHLIDNARFLCLGFLEPIRAKFGEVVVHDGYRDPEHNQRVGGKVNSYHLFGGTQSAADFSIPGYTPTQVFDWIRLESELPFDMVILERNPDGFATTIHLQVDSAAMPRRQAFTGSTGDGTVYVAAEVK